jgi:hypothetical protein
MDLGPQVAFNALMQCTDSSMTVVSCSGAGWLQTLHSHMSRMWGLAHGKGEVKAFQSALYINNGRFRVLSLSCDHGVLGVWGLGCRVTWVMEC